VNGVHDMGGMQGMGELGYEPNGPVFHAPWEGRVHAMATALNVYGKWRGLRPEIELIPAPDYLRMSYYERWLTALTERIAKTGLATRAEIESGRADAGAARVTPALTAADAAEIPLRTPRTQLESQVRAGFRVGDRVRGRNINPATHTRMPRYTRGKAGIVERDRGVFALPDNEAYFLDPKPQHVYLIRFAARELWGETASPHDALYIDLWEDYLERA
jgi:nitrile hydratase subunit beta